MARSIQIWVLSHIFESKVLIKFFFRKIRLQTESASKLNIIFFETTPKLSTSWLLYKFHVTSTQVCFMMVPGMRAFAKLSDSSETKRPNQAPLQTFTRKVFFRFFSLVWSLVWNGVNGCWWPGRVIPGKRRWLLRRVIKLGIKFLEICRIFYQNHS